MEDVERAVGSLVQSIRAKSLVELARAPVPMTLRSFVLPRLTWDPEGMEAALHIVLPPDLRQLWKRTGGLVLFQDERYGQWGLVVWSPDQAMVRHKRYLARWRGSDVRPGDLIIGEFLGDSDLLVVRCDPSQADYGGVAIADPIDHREDWYRPAPSLLTFLEKFLRSPQAKYWEKH